MSRPFSAATAEQVVAVTEAVAVLGESDPGRVETFVDLPAGATNAALKLSADLGLVEFQGNKYKQRNSLCRFIVSANVDANVAVLRIVLETYRPFVVFRQRLVATDDATTAAAQTKSVLDLDAHRNEIRQTLVSLGTYSQALATGKGASVTVSKENTKSDLQILAEGADDLAAAEVLIREQLGEILANSVSQDDILNPLSDAAHRARSGDGAGAVQAAGNAVESYLVEVAGRVNVNLQGANGVNAKVDRLKQNWTLPQKLQNVGKYLGHVRNAADHGHDADVQAAWEISPSTGTNYVFVACSFMASLHAHEQNAGSVL